MGMRKVKEESFGQMGFGHVKERNLALLGKWLWCFSLERGSFWQFIIHRYMV